MNILFLTLLDFSRLEEQGIYTDLMREFVKVGHNVIIISPTEKKKKQPTKLIDFGNYKILKLQIGNIQKTNIIEKGISTILLEQRYIKGIKDYFSKIVFDLVIYTTPPITLQKAIEYVKRRDNAKTYLLLKDIFPQNAIDLGMLKKTGLKGIVYKYFRSKEIKLYSISDHIGCMSPANVRYVLKNNPEIPREKVEVCPNSIEPIDIDNDIEIKEKIKKKYRIPSNKTVFIYGGNLGKPQGINFIIKCLKSIQNNDNTHFVIVGNGTEFYKIKTFIDFEKISNVQLLSQLSKDDYEKLVCACDVGLVFLDYRFTIPNFPSRILSYMQASIPILASTDKNTDIGDIIENGGFGYWCESTDVSRFSQLVKKLCNPEIRKQMGPNARKYLENNYSAHNTYEIIMKHFIKQKEGTECLRIKHY